ncbi:MAG: DNA/RNA nuclease SfsA [Oscillospiraceae bacterium]
MQYSNLVFGTFLARPNRFIAQVEINGAVYNCHVKNTSRLQELLLPGTPTALQRADNPLRKTAYTLIAVQHGSLWVNIDSMAPNHLFGEWVARGEFIKGLTLVRPETRFEHSRFDYYLEAGPRKIFAEIKGVTLVESGIARFPGAPTTRGTKHLTELCHCLQAGYEAMVVFVIKRSDVRGFAPNDALDPAFGKALRLAAKQGVQITALTCAVEPGQLQIQGPVPVLLE